MFLMGLYADIYGSFKGIYMGIISFENTRKICTLE